MKRRSPFLPVIPPALPVGRVRTVLKMSGPEITLKQRAKDEVALKVRAAKRAYYEKNADKWRTVYAQNRRRKLQAGASA